jgi:hypothetical protein
MIRWSLTLSDETILNLPERLNDAAAEFVTEATIKPHAVLPGAFCLAASAALYRTRCLPLSSSAYKAFKAATQRPNHKTHQRTFIGPPAICEL